MMEEPTAMMEEPTAMMEEPTAMMEEPTAMMEEPTAMMEGPTPTAMMEGPTPTAMMEGPTPTAMMEGPTPTAMIQPTPTSTPPPIDPGLQPKYGGIMNMQAISGQRTWDPYAGGVFEDLHCGSSMYSQLIRYNPINSTELVADVARDWSVSDDGLIYTFFLREDITWTDGEKLTADDVVFSFARMLEGGERPQVSKIGPYVKEVRKVDEYTVEVELNWPSTVFVQFIGTFWYKILPQHHLEGRDPDFLSQFENNTVGTGPFIPVEYIVGQSCEFAKNDNHFVEGRPYIDGFRGQVIVDSGTVIAAFKTERIVGGLSMVNNLLPEDLVRLQQDDDFISKHDIWTEAPNPGASLFVMINTRVEPFDNDNVRRAMFLALDRQTMADGFGLGFYPVGRPIEADSPWALPEEELFEFPGYRQLNGMKHPDDIAEAQRLMAAEGYSEDNPLKAEILGPVVIGFPDHAQVIADQYRQIYIDLTVRVQDISSSFASFTQRDFELAAFGDASSIHDPDDRFQSAYTTRTPRNFTGWDDPEVLRLFDLQTREADVPKRRELLHDMQRQVLRGAPGVVEYFTLAFIPVTSKKVKTALGHYHKCDSLYKCYQHDVEWLDDKY
jgi:peptide/nickel transport system substrate-binding protein